MKSRRYRPMVAVLVLVIVGAPAFAGEETGTDGSAPDLGGLEKLVGTWKAPAYGTTARSTYTLTAGGSALVETLEMGDESPMVTVYHRDGEELMLTHYCSLRNQPRMRAKAGGEVVDFRFVDATNLASDQAPHMHGVKIEWVDADHFTQEWTTHQDGRVTDTLRLAFERVK